MVKIIWEPGDIFETASGWGMVIGKENSIIFSPPTDRSLKVGIRVFMCDAMPWHPATKPVNHVGDWTVVMCIKTAAVLLGIEVDWVSLLKL